MPAPDERRAAVRTDWKNEPFGATISIPYKAEYSAWEFARLSRGLIPEAMEDKWFVFYEAPCLYLHRSWTGIGVYRVTLERQASRHVVAKADWAPASKGSGKDVAVDIEHEVAMLDFLISNLLLRQAKPFPLPAGESDSGGLLQHHLSGTGYPAAPSD